MASNQSISVEGSRLDLTMTKGTDFGPVTVLLTDENDAPIDLTGATIIVKYQRSSKQGSVMNFGADIPAPATDGKMIFALVASKTISMVAGEQKYDWNLWVSRGGIVTPIYYGKISVLEQVSE